MPSVGLLLLAVPSILRVAVAPVQRAPVLRACAADAPRWFVTVPRSLAGVSEQAARSVLSAAQADERRMVVEASLPELDPTSPAFRYMELLAFVQQLGLNLLNSGTLPRSRPHVKLLFCGAADATLAGGAITYTNLPVSVLGAQTCMGEQDGAFILVTPRAGQGVGQAAAVEAAAARVLAAAGSRPVIVVRPLTVSYMEDSTASSLSRGGACLLRCFPHEWSVLADPSRKGSWSYVGRFDARPSPTQLEKMLMAGMTDLRNRRYRDNAAAAERERGGLATGGEGPSAP